VAIERRDIAIRALTATECRAGDLQTVVTDGIEDAQPCVGTVARQQDDLDTGLSQQFVQRQKLVHQHEGIAWLQWFILVGYLVLLVGLKAMLLVNLMTLIKVEQGARRDGDDQLVDIGNCAWR